LKANNEDHYLAEDLATRAGLLLLEERKLGKDSDPEVLKQRGDQKSHNFLMEELASLRPKDGVLSEEGSANPVHPNRSDTSRVWIVDPLDGTREFGEPQRDDWAVHVALAVGGLPVVGAVAIPALNLTFSTCNDFSEPSSSTESEKIQIAVSRSRPPVEASQVAEKIDGALIEMGSAGAKAMAVVRGIADMYIHSGGQYEWDNCAPAAVAFAAGLHVSRLDGSPLTYNNPDPWLPDLLICNPVLASPVLEILNS
jgi:3'(2'), 5'-bisphosphate nucleotidase